MALPSTAEVAENWQRNLPSRSGRFVATLLRWASWPWLILSFVGVLSNVRTLVDWVLAAAAWLSKQGSIIRALVSAISDVFRTWRGIVDPIREWISGWLPFSIPVEAFDIFLLLLLPLIRVFPFIAAKQRTELMPFFLILDETPERQQKIDAYFAPLEKRYSRTLRILVFAIFLAIVGVGLIAVDASHRRGWF